MARYCLPVFLGAFLLFQVQPIVARAILPWFGGSPSVWTTCMLVFQSLLLVGYAFAHLVVGNSPPRSQAGRQLVILALPLALMGFMVLTHGTTILPPDGWKPEGGQAPAWHIVRLLVMTVGLPYLVLATTSPLLQAWFSRTNPQSSPYRLYALSNVGSLLALISYPFVIEPMLDLSTQATIWAVAYVVFTIGYGACALGLLRLPKAEAPEAPPSEEPADDDAERLGWLRPALWVALPALASVMLLASTNHLCVDVAAVPFLWVLPLAIYLLSFIICFDSERWYIRALFVPPTLTGAVALLALREETRVLDIRHQIAIWATFLFFCCMVCHGELVGLKPKPRRLTAFYLAVAAGGALGGILVGAVAPHVFAGYVELPLGTIACAILAAIVVLLQKATWPLWLRIGTIGTAVALAAFLAVNGCFAHAFGDQVAYQARSFYGVIRVRHLDKLDPERARHIFMHGTTTHGYQFQAPELRRAITSYYSPSSGIGRAFTYHPARLADDGKGALRIGITGLGAGSLIAWARPHDTVRFYEIDPEVVRVAQDPEHFTYLSDFEGRLDVELGDARITLERELAEGRPQAYDVMVLDAFTSDAVPTHLLTTEAFEIYLRHLDHSHGVICVNIANRVLDLAPVVKGLARHFRLNYTQVFDRGDDDRYYITNWCLLSYDADYLGRPEFAEVAEPVSDDDEVAVWTDHYHNLFRHVF